MTATIVNLDDRRDQAIRQELHGAYRDLLQAAANGPFDLRSQLLVASLALAAGTTLRIPFTDRTAFANACDKVAIQLTNLEGTTK